MCGLGLAADVLDGYEWILSGWFMTYRYVSLFAVWLLVLPSAFAQGDIAAEDNKVSDVRILIDISGSMKRNDPNNLRIPALKLITQLLPNGSRGGVWAFGQYINMLVKSGEVNEAWKKQAYQAANKINSSGMFTNIEDVLKDATWDWSRPDEHLNRSIILLTDGVVDISKDASVNKAARARILDKALTRLKNSGVTIHTIALSNEADKAFLRQLSAATSGAYEQVETAAQLERVFLKMFEKSVAVESLPMSSNKMLVDDSIRELTLLIFRKEGTQDASITLPNGEKFDFNIHPDNVTWRHEERYDLVTVQRPMVGGWQINAELDPDNRVMVVTDLKVRASRLPNMMLVDDQVPYYVELHEKGAVITKPEFLDFVTVMLNREHAGFQQQRVVLTDDGKGADRHAGDGRFSTRIGEALGTGHYEYEMLVNGTTFKRSKRYTVQVVDSPVAVNVAEMSSGDPAHYALTLTPYAELVNSDTLLVKASVTKEGGGTRSISIPRTGPNEWRLDMDVMAGDQYHVDLTVEAERINGKPITKDLGRFTLGVGPVDDYQPPEINLPPVIIEREVSHHAPAGHEHVEASAADEPAQEAPVEKMSPEHGYKEAHPQQETEPDASVEDAPVTQEEQAEERPVEEMPAHDDSDAHAEEEHEPTNWIVVAAKVIGLNGVLILAGFFAYRKWFRTPPEDQEESVEEVDEKGDEK